MPVRGDKVGETAVDEAPARVRLVVPVGPEQAAGIHLEEPALLREAQNRARIRATPSARSGCATIGVRPAVAMWVARRSASAREPLKGTSMSTARSSPSR